MFRAISIVCQGPIVNETEEIVEKWLSCRWVGDIILSTWEEQTFNLKNSRLKVIYNNKLQNNGPNNVNAQIHTTNIGLQNIKTRFTIKTRTDLWIKNMDLMGPEIHYKLNQSRVGSNGVFYKIGVLGNYHESFPFLVADQFHIGSTADLKTLWNVPFDKSNNKYGTEYSIPAETYIHFPYFLKLDQTIYHYWENPVEYLSQKGQLREQIMPKYKDMYNKLFYPLNLQLWWPKKGIL